MELIVFVIAVGLIVAANHFGRNVLFSLRGINEKLYSIQQENSNIQQELHEVKVLLEAKSGRKAKEINCGKEISNEPSSSGAHLLGMRQVLSGKLHGMRKWLGQDAASR